MNPKRESENVFIRSLLEERGRRHVLDGKEVGLFEHQFTGVEELVKWNDIERGRTLGGCYFLTDEMGLGKTRQIIDAAQVLFLRNEIDQVLVVCPASVRDVWYEEDGGELSKYLWYDLAAQVIEFHQKDRGWNWEPRAAGKALRFYVTNYDYVRSRKRKDARRRDTSVLDALLDLCTSRTMLVLDESSAVNNHRAYQSKACVKLRRACGRIVLLNGTPIWHSPNDLYGQGVVLQPKILDCTNHTEFRSRYVALEGGHGSVLEWRDVEDLQRRFAPYVLRREKKDCLDLPEKMPAVSLDVPLNARTWRMYKDMRDQMIAYLDEHTAAPVQHAVVKLLRLAQLTSGFLGGLRPVDDEPAPDLLKERPDWLHEVLDKERPKVDFKPLDVREVQAIGREKLDFFLKWFAARLEEDPNEKLLLWCRFRPELERFYTEIEKKFPHVDVGKIAGGQKREERRDVTRLLDPLHCPRGPVVVVGNTKAGGMGLNLTACHTVVFATNGYSLGQRLQAMDRVHRLGQTHAVSYFDLIATGPKGQRTIEHTITTALRKREEIATWTIEAWKRVLEDE